MRTSGVARAGTASGMTAAVLAAVRRSGGGMPTSVAVPAERASADTAATGMSIQAGRHGRSGPTGAAPPATTRAQRGADQTGPVGVIVGIAPPTQVGPATQVDPITQVGHPVLIGRMEQIGHLALIGRMVPGALMGRGAPLAGIGHGTVRIDRLVAAGVMAMIGALVPVGLKVEMRVTALVGPPVPDDPLVAVVRMVRTDLTAGTGAPGLIVPLAENGPMVLVALTVASELSGMTVVRTETADRQHQMAHNGGAPPVRLLGTGTVARGTLEDAVRRRAGARMIEIAAGRPPSVGAGVARVTGIRPLGARLARVAAGSRRVVDPVRVRSRVQSGHRGGAKVSLRARAADQLGRGPALNDRGTMSDRLEKAARGVVSGAPMLGGETIAVPATALPTTGVVAVRTPAVTVDPVVDLVGLIGPGLVAHAMTGRTAGGGRIRGRIEVARGHAPSGLHLIDGRPPRRGLTMGWRGLR